MKMDDIREALTFLACLLTGIFIIFASIFTPLIYLTGTANSRWLKETRGLDIPWHEAAFLDLKINDVEANVDIKEN